MPQRLYQVGQWTISVDPSEVQRHYASAQIDWCECDGCTNWRLTRARFMPSELRDFLQSLGLRLGDSLADTDIRDRGDVPSGFYRKRPYYVVPGEIHSKGHDPASRYGSRCALFITDERTEYEERVREHNLPGLARPLLYLRTSLLLPWLPGEMRSFKSVQSSQCRQCGRTNWLITGRLKRHSRIPAWYEVELGERPQDYVASFCWECGHPGFSYLP